VPSREQTIGGSEARLVQHFDMVQVGSKKGARNLSTIIDFLRFIVYTCCSDGVPRKYGAERVVSVVYRCSNFFEIFALLWKPRSRETAFVKLSLLCTK
jgi:hypothetical protein